MTSFVMLPHDILSAVSGGLTPTAQALEEAYKKGFADHPWGTSPHLGGLLNVYRKGAFDIVEEGHNQTLTTIRNGHILK